MTTGGAGNRDPRWGEDRDMDPQVLCMWLCSPKGHPASGDQRLGPGSRPSGFYRKVWGRVAVEGVRHLAYFRS